MNRLALFVDAGYLLAGAAQSISGQHVPRKQIVINAPNAFVEALQVRAKLVADNNSFLRAYWYDALV